ncbi:hypothetical protein MMC10_006641 [Thelotrema lepadinum]|nr:hypothetical protein [Thelotrema lepadinum]
MSGKQEPRESPTEEVEPPSIPYTIFTSYQKTLLLVLVSVAGTFSTCASNVYFPAIPSVAADLHVSTELINLSVTLYLVFQGISPTFWGALSDVKGRRLTYMCTFVVFIGACIGLAETKNYPQLLVLRCLQSSGSASTIAIGSGVLGDITTREERGGYMGTYQGIILIPIAIGPILGGVFANTLGWRAIFWFLTIYGAVFMIILILALPETLRALVGNGSIPPKGLAKSPLAYLQRRRRPQEILIRSTSNGPDAPSAKAKIDILGTIRILFDLKATFAILFISIYYTIWQMVLTTLSTLFESTYNLTEIQTGLCYLSNGIGCILGTFLAGRLLDIEYRRYKARYAGPSEDFPLEKARLRATWLYATLQTAALVVFGWTLDKGIHISVPLICLFLIGWASVSIQSCVTTFIVDVYTDRSASATAALNLVRCLLGAAGTAAITPCIEGIGVGWAFTLFAGILAACGGLLVLQMTVGRKIRVKGE